MRSRGIAAVAASLLALAATSATTASAEPGGKKPRFEGTVYVDYDEFANEFHGVVSSENPKCLQNRNVTVVRLPSRGGKGLSDRRGGGPTFEDRPLTLGIDRTNVEGKFRVRGTQIEPFSNYRVRVQQKIGQKYICEFIISPIEFYVPSL